MKMRAALNDTLRKKMIEAMLYMILTFQFFSISHGQPFLILNLLREAFGEEDLELMKSFIKLSWKAILNNGSVAAKMSA